MALAEGSVATAQPPGDFSERGRWLFLGREEGGELALELRMILQPRSEGRWGVIADPALADLATEFRKIFVQIVCRLTQMSRCLKHR
jgi:hypothetical protein